MSQFDEWVGCIVRWVSVVFMVGWLVYAVSDYLWKRMPMTWRLAVVAVLRKEAIARELDKQRAKK